MAATILNDQGIIKTQQEIVNIFVKGKKKQRVSETASTYLSLIPEFDSMKLF
jgi:hypothetical protein